MHKYYWFELFLSLLSLSSSFKTTVTWRFLFFSFYFIFIFILQVDSKEDNGWEGVELFERVQSRMLRNSCFHGGCVCKYYYVEFLLFCALYFVFITTYYLEIPLEYLLFSLSLLLTVVFFRFTRCSGNMIQLSISLYIFNLVFS